MKTIIIVRHSEPQKGVDMPTSEIPLSEWGRKKASDFFSNALFKDWNCIYASPYLRAVETAYCCGGQVILDNRLRERELGDRETLDEKFWERQYQDFTFKNKNGESLGEAARRMNSCMYEIYGKIPDGGRAVVISHAAAICAFLSGFCEISVVDAARKWRKIVFQKKVVLNGSIETPSAFVIQVENEKVISVSYEAFNC